MKIKDLLKDLKAVQKTMENGDYEYAQESLDSIISEIQIIVDREA